MKIDTFGVEQWMDDHETTAKHNLAETCCASISIKELLDLSSMPVEPLSLLDINTAQTYGEIRGSSTLRTNLSALYSARTAARLPSDNVLITPGAIAANHLVFLALVEPGDHVICQYPTYQSLYSVPQSFGADVDFWESRPEKQWVPDVAELKALVKPNTKLIVLNTPQNPTGAVLKKSLLAEIVELAKEKGITILSDEVYRPLFTGISPVDEEFPPSLLSMQYENTIVTGSMSKAYSLAGIRVGWIASRSRDVIEKCAAMRHYTTLTVSKLDQQVATFALSGMAIHELLGRNIKLAKQNLAALEGFISQHGAFCEWVKPLAGTTAFVKFKRDGKPVDDVKFCTALQDKTGVMILPGSCFGEKFKGWVRIGYVQEAKVVSDGLAELTTFMQSEFASIPTV